MVKLLVYLAIALVVIAASQLMRVFELASQLKGERRDEYTHKDFQRQGRMFMVFLIGFFAFCLWQCIKYKNDLLPMAASDQGVELDWLFWFNMIIIGIVSIIVNWVLFYMCYKYYSRPDATAVFYPHNNKLELLWTIVPAVVLAVIIVLGIRLWSNITAPAPADSIVIELYAKQFDWTARYAGKDNQLGRSTYKLIEGANALGMDSTDEKGWDDMVVKNEIHIPIGKTVEFKINSRDVIHSVFLPHFRAQINAVPGMTTSLHFVPTITTEVMRTHPEVIDQVTRINAIRALKGEDVYVFDYVLLCNKICGASHYNMQMNIVVDTPEQYEAFIAKQKTFFKK